MITVGIKINGGLGTILARANFSCYFYKRFKEDICLTVFGHSANDINKGIFKRGINCDQYFSSEKYSSALEKSFDLFIIFDALPNVKIFNSVKIKKESSELWNIIQKWVKFKKDNEVLFKYLRPAKPYVYEYIKGRRHNILNSLDITEDFSVDADNYLLDISWDIDIDSTLKHFGISRNFITIQRGANPRIKSKNIPKIWPHDYYEKLIALLKIEFPSYQLVQVGEASDSSSLISGVDISVVGRTNFRELKAILKSSFLHIDSECGMVHLRKALHGGTSVVLFGPTTPEIFGYPSNLNLRTDKCIGCTEINSNWEVQCCNKSDPVCCMRSLTPDYVLNYICDWKNGNIKKVNNYSLKNALLFKDTRIRLNEEWVNSRLIKEEIYDYSIINVRIGDLYFHKFVGGKDKWKLWPISESPVFKYLQGKKDEYYADLNIREKELDGNKNPHSEQRLIALLQSLEEQGYKTDSLIVINSLNQIIDGYHRASYLLFKFGENFRINVLRIYSDTKLRPDEFDYTK